MKLSTAGLVLAPDSPIDLQLHTTYSDGGWQPEQLLAYLAKEQFGLAAITDHDRVDIAATFQQLAIEKRMPLLVAVEISASWHGEPTDVLCYGFDPDKGALLEVGDDIILRQQQNTQQVFENLVQSGFTFPDTPIELQALLAQPSAQQPHAIVALMNKHGYGSEELSAGKLVLQAGCTFATTDIAVVVKAAHHDEGVCLIAHPGRGGGYICYDADLLDKLRNEVPIDGFEVYYPAHSPEQIAMYKEYAQKHNLLTSSGSDSHSPEPDNLPIKYRAELSRNLLERLGVQI